MKVAIFILGVMILTAIIPAPYNVVAAVAFGFILSGIDLKKKNDN
jgi:hypothetical protein